MVKWIEEPRRRFDDRNLKLGEIIPHEVTYIRPTSNGGEVISNGIEIDTGHLYSGSGPEAFGGISKWPRVRVEVTIPVKRYDIQDELVKELKSCIDKVLDKYKVPSEE
jgi:hypothetical protein